MPSIDLSNIKSVINPNFWPYLINKDRFMVLYGGAGSGKSVFIGQKILIRILMGMIYNKKHKVLCLRKTQPSCRKSIFALFLALLSEWGMLNETIVRVNNTEMLLTFANGSQIICAGLDDHEKLKSIHGITSAWLEEANELTIDDYRQVNLRVRGGTDSYKQIAISFNPISKLIWLHNEFFENNKENATIMHSTYLDNKFLREQDPDYIKELESYKDIDETYYNIYTLGQWGQLLEAIYSKYQFIDKFPEEKTFKDKAYGLDVGFNVQSALSFIGRKDEEYYIKELLYQKKLTHPELVDSIKLVVPKQNRRTIMYVDSAEPELIKLLNQNGFIAKKSDKSVKEGIDFCKSQTIYLDKESTNLCKEVPAYSYRKNNDGNVLEEPIKINDHLCDSFRYPMYTHWGKIRRKSSVVFI